MEIDKPCLFLEINDKNFIFLVAQYDENFNYKVIESTEVKSEGILDGKIIDIELSSKILKTSIVSIEKKIGFTFKSTILISNQNNFECINISGYKKLAGSQIFNDDISYILNKIKKIVLDNNPKKLLIHLFNSNFVLDNAILSKLPIGLYGEFYNQHLTFFLLPEHELKNMKLTLKNCNINIERFIFKVFAQGIKKLNTKELSLLINIQEKRSDISIFDNSSLVFSEPFNFGSDLIISDVSKISSLTSKVIKEIFKDEYFKNNEVTKNNGYLDSKYFEESRFRQISKDHLKEVVKARIDEIVEIIYKKNINLSYFKNNKKNIHIFLEDPNICINFSDDIKNSIAGPKDNVTVDSIKTQDERFLPAFSSAELVSRGWEKEAIPIVETKKSIISSLFSIFFSK